MERLRYVAWRVLIALPTVLAVVCLNFLLLHLAPGDAASVLAGESGGASPKYVALLRHNFGLDKPLYVQLALYIKNIFSFDLGFSYVHNSSVLDLILSRVGPTLLLMSCSLGIAIGVGVLLGLVAATKRGTPIDSMITMSALGAYATPTFWLGLMLILIFSLWLGWFPVSGMEDIAGSYTGWARRLDIAHHLVLPAITLALFYLALYLRLMRSAVLEQMKLDYVTTARAKGLTERAITFHHILRNATLPVVTMAGVQAGNLLGGSVVVEAVFGWPGLGSLTLNALMTRDLNLLLGIFFVSACLVVLTNVLIDVCYTVLDPRVEMH